MTTQLATKLHSDQNPSLGRTFQPSYTMKLLILAACLAVATAKHTYLYNYTKQYEDGSVIWARGFQVVIPEAQALDCSAAGGLNAILKHNNHTLCPDNAQCYECDAKYADGSFRYSAASQGGWRWIHGVVVNQPNTGRPELVMNGLTWTNKRHDTEFDVLLVWQADHNGFQVLQRVPPFNPPANPFA